MLANPAEMISMGAPRVIHNDQELEVYTDALFQLTALKNPSADQEAAIELLTLLIDHYEQEHYSVRPGSRLGCAISAGETKSLTTRSYPAVWF
jgi:HTH-type transcriptional regulator/antitoxin HigA